jgi:hypothetical protein
MFQFPLPAQHCRGKNPGESPISRLERGRFGPVGEIRQHLLKGPLINQHTRDQLMREIARR